MVQDIQSKEIQYNEILSIFLTGLLNKHQLADILTDPYKIRRYHKLFTTLVNYSTHVLIISFTYVRIKRNCRIFVHCGPKFLGPILEIPPHPKKYGDFISKNRDSINQSISRE